MDMYAGATLTWQQGGQSLKAHMITDFPFRPEVRIQLSSAHPMHAKLRIRVPAWATKPMAIRVNGQPMVTGKPGTYAVLDRTWKEGDAIAFTLPMEFRLTPYVGAEQNQHLRYALEYGPILMALTGEVDAQGNAQLNYPAEDLLKRLQPVPGQPLHFAIDGDAQHQYLPYWQVAEETFTCYPVIETPGTHVAEVVGPDDLALASRGAVASSDSEYAREPGNTSRVIDGIIATPQDFTNRWHSSLETPHPHWIQVKLPKPARVGRIVIRFADPQGHPTSFQGIVRVNGKDRVVFDVKEYGDWRQYRITISPVLTDTFRLVIRDSANPAYPNAAQISEIELYPPGREGQILHK